MRKLFLLKYYLLAATIVAAILLFDGFQKAIQVDNSLTIWFLEDDPALIPYQKFQDNFGNDELIIMVYKPENSLFEKEELERIKSYGDELELHPDVERQWSISNIRLPTGSFGIANTKLLGDSIVPWEVKARIADYPFIENQILNKDSEAVRFVIQLRKADDFDDRRQDIIESIYSLTDQYLNSDRSFFGGVGVLYHALNKLSKEDFGKFLGIGYALMFLLIFLLYKDFRFVLYALITISLATYFTIAIYGALGYKLNLLTTLIPAIIILLCVMDVMHIINEQSEQSIKLSGLEKSMAALSNVWKACFLTSLTTMAGFLALLASPVAILKVFGAFSALGILFGLLFSYLVGFIMLPNMPLAPLHKKSSKVLVSLQNWVISNQKRTLVLSFTFLLIALIGISKLKVDTDSLSYLPDEHIARRDVDSIQNNWGAFMPLEFLIEPTQDLNKASFVRAFAQFDSAVVCINGVGGVNSYPSLLAAISKDRYGKGWRAKLNDKRLLRIQSFLSLSNPELELSFVNKTNHIQRFNLEGELVSAGELEKIKQESIFLWNKYLGSYGKVEASGYQSLYSSIVNHVTTSQVRSFGLAFILIFILLLIGLRDPKLSIISLIPNIFPVVIMFGSMGLLKINLDTATASIASIVLSFCIDDTIHFITRYKELRLLKYTPEEARRLTVAKVGRAILLTSIVLFLGYFTMLFGSLKTVVYFGALSAISILAALYSQFFIFPILLNRWDSKVQK